MPRMIYGLLAAHSIQVQHIPISVAKLVSIMDCCLRSSKRTMGEAAATVELRILSRLGLARVAIADQLVLILKRFRAAQLRDVEDTLNALPPSILSHIESHYDHKVDVKDELERYTQDLVKGTHLLRHLEIEGDLKRDVLTMLGALGDGADRALLIKMVQALGIKRLRILCLVCLQLPSTKLQQDFYRVFAADTAMPELKSWMRWLDEVRSSDTAAWDNALELFTKCLMERSLVLWLGLLAPLPSATRVAVIERVHKSSAPLMKEIGHFHSVTGLPVTKLLEICDAFFEELPVFLCEFTMATTLTVFAKFNSDELISSVRRAIALLGKGEVVRLIDALALEERPRPVAVFFVTLIEFPGRVPLASFFLNLPRPSQARFLGLLDVVTTRTENPGEESSSDQAFIVFQFLLEGHLRDVASVLATLSGLPTETMVQLFRVMRTYTTTEITLIGELVEAVTNRACLPVIFRLFDVVPAPLRSTVVDWVLAVPDSTAIPLYDLLFRVQASQSQERMCSILQMMAALSKRDKHELCSQLLRGDSSAPHDAQRVIELIVFFLTDVGASRRHQCIKLLATIPDTSYSTLFQLLSTQRLPEQHALTKLLLSLSSTANGRVLAKLNDLPSEARDEFFQLLMLIPKVEYKNLARLLVSNEVAVDQLNIFVHLAANMMNQASSREMVIFASELPARYRNMFFEMLAESSALERGVVMRIVACSTRVASDLLHLLVEVLRRMQWETRSTLVEQLRALEDGAHIRDYVLLLRAFDDDAWLPRLVHLIALLPMVVRIALVPLFAQVPTVDDRKLALEKLDGMRKDKMPSFIAAVCDAQSAPFVGASFLRVLAYLTPEYQHGMIKLLQFRECWVFIDILASSLVDETSDDGPSNASVVNGLAAAFTLLKVVEDFVLLGDIMEEAMGNGIHLEELIVVLSYFRDRERLLGFLHYIARLTRVAPSTLFFRVLSRSKATGFLFEMCHVLDMDDALFALKRLDRMWSHDAAAVDQQLLTMASKGAAILARDEFCHLVLGYKERPPAMAHEQPKNDRTLAPRPNVSSRAGERKHIRKWEGDMVAGGDEDAALLLTVLPESRSSVVVGKQLDRVRDKREDARQRRRRRRNWRDWTAADWDAITGATPDEPERSDQHGEVDSCHPDDSGSSPFDTESVEETDSSTEPLNEMPFSPPARSIPSEASPQRPDQEQSNSVETREELTLDEMPTPDHTMPRSESAPALGLRPVVNRSKLYRGLADALGIDGLIHVHVGRDRGATIFHKQCVEAYESSPTRLRFARTEAAQAKVMRARVEKALGQRTQMAPLSPMPSLLRSERHTIEMASAAIRSSEQLRHQIECVQQLANNSTLEMAT